MSLGALLFFLGAAFFVIADIAVVLLAVLEKQRHGFREWSEGRVVCRCGWRSLSGYQDGLDQLRVHEQHHTRDADRKFTEL